MPQIQQSSSGQDAAFAIEALAQERLGTPSIVSGPVAGGSFGSAAMRMVNGDTKGCSHDSRLLQDLAQPIAHAQAASAEGMQCEYNWDMSVTSCLSATPLHPSATSLQPR